MLWLSKSFRQVYRASQAKALKSKLPTSAAFNIGNSFNQAKALAVPASQKHYHQTSTPPFSTASLSLLPLLTCFNKFSDSDIYPIEGTGLDKKKVISAFGGKGAGNIGFIGLKNGITASELVPSISKYISTIHDYTKQATPTQIPQDGYLFINEAAYAKRDDPSLSRNPETDEPQTIVTITPENIEHYIKQHQFAADKDPAALLELNGKVTRITADAFVTNVSTVNDKQFYLVAAGADAPALILCDQEMGISAVISCSWHVFCSGTIAEVIESMVNLGADPKNIILQYGPGLGPKSYVFGEPKAFYSTEVGADGVPIWKGADPEYTPDISGEKYFKKHPIEPGKFLVNFFELVKHSSGKAGIPPENIFNLNRDTFTDHKFHGARKKYPDEETRKAAAQNNYASVMRNGSFITTMNGKKNGKNVVDATPNNSSASTRRLGQGPTYGTLSEPLLNNYLLRRHPPASKRSQPVFEVGPRRFGVKCGG